IQSRRAMGVMLDHIVRAAEAPPRALRRSAGIRGSGSFPTERISNGTTSPTSAPAPFCILLSTLSQWLFRPSGSSVARKGWPLMTPSTVVMPRVGSFALASFGRIRKAHELPFEGSAGRKSRALKRIFEEDPVIAGCEGGRGRLRSVSSGLELSAILIEDVSRDPQIGCRLDVVLRRECTDGVADPVDERFHVFPLVEEPCAHEGRSHSAVTVERLEVVGVQKADVGHFIPVVTQHSSLEIVQVAETAARIVVSFALLGLRLGEGARFAEVVSVSGSN